MQSPLAIRSHTLSVILIVCSSLARAEEGQKPVLVELPSSPVLTSGARAVKHLSLPPAPVLLGTDVRVTNSTVPQNETSIVADPSNANIVIGGINDYSVALPAVSEPGVVYSTNGGVSWIHAATGVPMTAGYNNLGCDPGVTFNSTGRAIYSYLGAGPGVIFQRNSGVFVSSSLNGGASWSASVAVSTIPWPGSGTVPFEDKPLSTCDHNAGSPFINQVYVSWTRFYNGNYPGSGTVGGGDIMFSLSTNNGSTWSPAARLSDPLHETANGGTGTAGTSFVQGSEPEAESDGDVYVVYHFGGRTNVSRSTDGGTTFGTPTFPFGATYGVSSIWTSTPFSFRINAFPCIETDPARPEYVYVVAVDSGPGPGLGRDRGDIIFARSTNNGITWDPALILNNDASGNLQIFPWMAVDNSGNICVLWYDNRLSANLLDVYETYSTDGGTTWSSNLRVTDMSFNPNTGQFSGNSFFGDYNGIGAGPDGTFHMLWTDARVAEQEIYYDNHRLLPAFNATPISLNFSNVIVGSSSTDSVTVSNAGPGGLTISSVSSDHPSFTVSPPSGSIGPGGNMKFYVTFTPALPGAAAANIVFTHNAQGSPDTVAATGTGVSPGFSAVPSSLNFGNVNVGQTRTDSVTVTNVGSGMLTIDSVKSDNPEFTVLPTSGIIPPAGNQRFYVKFQPISPGTKSGNIIFYHNALSSPDTVPVSGNGTTSGFSVSPSSIDFGDVLVSSSRIDSVAVTNVGTVVLNISSVVSDNTSEFGVPSFSGGIPPTASRTFVITFHPTSEGLKTGNIIFTHDAAGSPDTVAVTGNGEDTLKFLTLPPDTIVAKDPIKAKFWKPVKRGKGLMPNWANLLSEVVVQGGFAPPAVNGSTESDSAGGMVIGVGYMNRLNPFDPLKPKWKPVKDSANVYAWVRLTKWDFKKSLGKSFNVLQKTLEDKTGDHYTGTPRIRGLDSAGNGLPTIETRKQLKKQLTKLAPKKHRNPLFTELVALKFNIVSSQLGKTPNGFGELIFDVDGNLCDELSILEISQKADSAMTYWRGRGQEEYDSLWSTIHRINRAFVGTIDTISFERDGELVLRGAADLAGVPFLKIGSVPARHIMPTTTQTESEEEFDFEDQEWEDWEERGVPSLARLYQNFPNPFNPTTTISFRLREYSIVTLKIYNMLGQEIATLVDGEEMEDGLQVVQFGTNGLPSGAYFYRLNARDVGNGERTVQIRKMLMLK